MELSKGDYFGAAVLTVIWAVMLSVAAGVQYGVLLVVSAFVLWVASAGFSRARYAALATVWVAAALWAVSPWGEDLNGSVFDFLQKEGRISMQAAPVAEYATLEHAFSGAHDGNRLTPEQRKDLRAAVEAFHGPVTVHRIAYDGLLWVDTKGTVSTQQVSNSVPFVGGVTRCASRARWADIVLQVPTSNAQKFRVDPEVVLDEEYIHVAACAAGDSLMKRDVSSVLDPSACKRLPGDCTHSLVYEALEHPDQFIFNLANRCGWTEYKIAVGGPSRVFWLCGGAPLPNPGMSANDLVTLLVASGMRIEPLPEHLREVRVFLVDDKAFKPLGKYCAARQEYEPYATQQEISEILGPLCPWYPARAVLLNVSLLKDLPLMYHVLTHEFGHWSGLVYERPAEEFACSMAWHPYCVFLQMPSWNTKPS